MQFEAAARTHVGRRTNNEDAYLVDDRLRLYAVADGMGGYEGGEVASRLALDAVAGFHAQLRADREVTWPFLGTRSLPPAARALEVAIRLAHRAVADARTGVLAQMGTTIAALLATDDGVAIAHLGDSRVYRWRGGALTRLTRDHSVVEELRASGALEAEGDGPESRIAHLLTRAIGLDGGDAPTVVWCDAAPGDRFLLCSDGLSGPVPHAALADHLGTPSRQAAVEQLVQAALARGGRDNITAVVVGVSG